MEINYEHRNQGANTSGLFKGRPRQTASQTRLIDAPSHTSHLRLACSLRMGRRALDRMREHVVGGGAVSGNDQRVAVVIFKCACVCECSRAPSAGVSLVLSADGSIMTPLIYDLADLPLRRPLYLSSFPGAPHPLKVLPITRYTSAPLTSAQLEEKPK